jgi:hyperosmotically inducible periplasmic protein
MSKLHLAAPLALALLFAGCSQERDASVAARQSQADNTARNVRDRNEAAPTPMDQGGSEADRTITQTIRQIVVDNGTLSTNAKNVKIITQNGIVTLRGPVDTDAEKSFIVSTARGVSGVVNVDDQLEVKVKTY